MAWEFVKFLVSPEQAAAYTEATGTPPTQTALLGDYYKQFEKCMKPEDMKVGVRRCVLARTRIVQPPDGTLGRSQSDLG